MRALAFCAVLAGCSEDPSVIARDVRGRFPAAPSTRRDLSVQLPLSASRPVHIQREAGVWLDISSHVRDVPAERIDQHTQIFRDAALRTDVVHIAEPHRFEELRWVRDRAATITFRYSVEWGPEIALLRVVDAIVEAVDHRGVARLRTEPAVAIDARGEPRSLRPTVVGHELTFTLDATGLIPPIAIDPAWTTTADLAMPRGGSSVLVTLPGKKVITLGGQTNVGALLQTEIYDAATKSWTLGPSMSRGRLSAAIITLEDGRVMAASGRGGTETNATSDLYDPMAGKITAAALAPFPSGNLRGVALAGNKALFLGSAGAAVYDATADTWTSVTPKTLRNNARLVRLPSGKVLVVCGSDASGGLSTTEIFDPATKSFASSGSMSKTHAGCSATLLGSKVVVIGGAGPPTTEIFDTVTSTWSDGPALKTPRSGQGAVALPDGRLFVVGGDDGLVLLKSAEMLDAAQTAWAPAGAMLNGRTSPPLAPIDPEVSSIVVAGGGSTEFRKDTEVFTPIGVGVACTGSSECLSGACNDGFCCEKSSCAADETCGGSAAPGKCRKKNGQPCTAGDVCGSGICVDGVCCDRACDGVCEACDVSAGSCATLAPGEKPHGPTRKCPGTGVCAALCGGIDNKTCTVFPNASTRCADAACRDGAESLAAFCDGAGACGSATSAKCEPYVCGERSCKKACSADSDCAAGYTCATRTGICVFGAKCDGDHALVVGGVPSIDCTPYRCNGVACITKCSSSADCVGGTTCNTTSGVCEPSTAPADAGGGCVAGGHRSGILGAIFALTLLLTLRRTRR
jgi:hypothetical protein